MVPMDYQDTTKWNRWETKYVSGIFVSAVVIDRMTWMISPFLTTGWIFQLGNWRI
jgi:hypothetical protein